MNRCPITYKPCGDNKYSKEGLKQIASGLATLKELDYTAEELRKEAYNRAAKMSIQGVQPKLSAVLNIKEAKFNIVDKRGRYILKPQHNLFEQLPENEDLTMHLAASIGLEIPIHGLIWAKDNSLTYFIKRFDRKGQNDKIPVEDFAQLSGHNRDTKYNSSMEQVVRIIDQFCTFPAVENIKLFKLTVFNFLIGNEDMHLKNFSIINQDGKISLSPCYDLINTTIEYKKPDDEIALPLKDKKKHLSRNIIIDYFGTEKCKLTIKSVDKVLESISASLAEWRQLIDISFLTSDLKTKYHEVLNTRSDILKIQ